MIKLTKGYVAVANKMMTEADIKFIKTGSISAIDEDKKHVIFRAAGVALGDIDVEKTVVVSLATGKVVGGGYTPPDDMSLHLEIYRRFSHIQSIAHTYPEWAMSYSTTGKEVPICQLEWLPILGRAIPCTELAYLAYGKGSEEQKYFISVNETISKLGKRECGAILLKCDGVLSWDKTPIKALECGKKVEAAADMAWKMQMLVPNEADIKIPEQIAETYVKSRNFDKSEDMLGQAGMRLTADDERKICLEMLIYFDRICRANGINYSLTGGTLLGAVRHKGFIPWDDDIDVFLPRPEFNKLEAVFPDSERFVLVNRHKEPRFNYVFSRLIDTKTLITESPNTLCAGKGVFLDICVVDGLPKNPFLREIHIGYMRFLMRARRATVQNPKRKAYRQKGPIVVLFKKVLRILTSYEFWNRRLEKAMERYPFDTSNYVGNFASQYGKKEMLPRKIFDTYLDIPFENHKFMVCVGYEQYLNRIYGKNYMNLPRRKKRKRPHPNVAYWI